MPIYTIEIATSRIDVVEVEADSADDAIALVDQNWTKLVPSEATLNSFEDAYLLED